jgi:hypothetical protein
VIGLTNVELQALGHVGQLAQIVRVANIRDLALDDRPDQVEPVVEQESGERLVILERHGDVGPGDRLLVHAHPSACED